MKSNRPMAVCLTIICSVLMFSTPVLAADA
jgi:hypothetical protein